ncbi:hypothetical protein PoB_002512400 [Plakobranchus ocellatus]|uniref:Uncharacterized protein n=1 Tax=Plakobranchus ocellatus TaxID=259542 RepID=A0AAV3ZXG4_9GAST|nr:hypothetical protein PoB_002512400 [Plakobranchus ocellatus]
MPPTPRIFDEATKLDSKRNLRRSKTTRYACVCVWSERNGVQMCSPLTLKSAEIFLLQSSSPPEALAQRKLKILGSADSDTLWESMKFAIQSDPVD